jgi:hypothetical protein
MVRPRIIAASGDAALGTLVRWVHARLDENGVTYDEIAHDLTYSRSWVSRGSCGRRLPPWELVEAVASRCGASRTDARKLWEAADASQRRRRVRVAAGTPPEGITSWQGMYDALGDLIAGRAGSQRALVRRDKSGQLRRATVGAIVRHDRSLSYDVLIQILAACEVTSSEKEKWLDTWQRWGRQRREKMEAGRRTIALSRLQPDRYPLPGRS